MLDIGFSELLVILAVALIVLGPQKLPQIARSLGRGLAELRRTSDDLRRSLLLEDEIAGRIRPPLRPAGSVPPTPPKSSPDLRGGRKPPAESDPMLEASSQKATDGEK